MTLEDQLFSLLEALCLAEGGDGDVALVTPHYRKAADLFEAWTGASRGPVLWHRENHDFMVTFAGPSQDALWFVADQKDLSPEVTAVIRYDMYHCRA